MNVSSVLLWEHQVLHVTYHTLTEHLKGVLCTSTICQLLHYVIT